MLLEQVSLLLCMHSILAFGLDGNTVKKRTFIGDPRRNITCLGSGYDLRLSLRPDGVDLNQLTMQQLCAKPIYGGSEVPLLLGGWCSEGLEPAWNNMEDDGTDDWTQDDMFPTRTGVSFDWQATTTDARSSWPVGTRWQDERLYAGCLNRCFCSWGVEDLTVQPKRQVPSNADMITAQTDDSGIFELKLEIAQMTDGYRADYYNRVNDGTDVKVLQIITDLGEPNETEGYAETHWRGWDEPVNLALDPGNEITCEGDLPSFELPPPYPNSEFSNPQELCATQWNGGLS